MPIQVACPQCQKRIVLPDDRRGKQVRCQECFQVFQAGSPPADSKAKAAPPPAPKPAPKPAAKPAPQAAAKPPQRPPVKAAPKAVAPVKAAPKSAARPAPRPPAKAVKSAPRDLGELPTPVIEAPARYRRRKGSGGMIAVGVLLVLLLLGGGAGAVVVLGYVGKLPYNPFAAAPADPRQAATKPPDAVKPPKKDDADPDLPKLDNPGSSKPDKPDPTKPDKPDPTKPDKPDPVKPDKPDPVKPDSVKPDQPDPVNPDKPDPTPPPPPPDKPMPGLTKENFDKIDRGMTMDAAKAVLGPPTQTDPLTGGAGVQLTWAADGKTVVVLLPGGKVGGKRNRQGWANTFPGDVAANPPATPPDRPAGRFGKDAFDKVDKGMTADALIALLGPPSQTTPGAVPTEETKVWSRLAVVATVTLRDGRVFRKESNQNWPVTYPSATAEKNPPPPPDKPTPGLTKENFDRIDKDMALDALTALLGQPNSMQNFRGPPSGVRIVWSADGVMIRVDVVEGKVAAKSNSQNWPVAYPGDVAVKPPPPPPPDKPPPGKAPQPFLEKQPDDNGVYGSAISADGKVFAFSGGQTGIQFWDAATGKPIAALKPDDRPALALALSSDGKQVASAELPNGGVKVRPMAGGGGADELGALDGVDCLTFAPDDKTLVVCNHRLVPGKAADYHVKLWRLPARDGESLTRTQTVIRSLAFCPDGKTLATGESLGVVELWDVSTKKHRPLLPQNQGDVERVVFSADGRTLASSANVDTDRPVVWDTAKGLPRCKLDAKQSRVRCLALSPGGKFAATGETPLAGPRAGLLKLWDATTGKELNSVVADPVQVKAIYFGADGKVLIAVGPKTIQFWNVADLVEGYIDDKAGPVADLTPAAPAAPAGTLCRENFDKVDKGMTPDEVTALLGAPNSTDKPAKGGPVDSRMMWTGRNGPITVDLIQGKVVAKGGAGAWIVVYPSDAPKNPPADKPSP